MNIGQKIHDLRIQNDMTLEELGDLVGVGKSTVRKWENGLIENMRRDKVTKLSKALGTTPSYLMGWDDNIKDSGSFIADIVKDTEFFNYVKSLYSLTYDEKLKVYGYIDALSNSK